MYSYFLSDYIYTVEGKDKRKLKDLTKGEIGQLVILSFCSYNNYFISNNKEEYLFDL